MSDPAARWNRIKEVFAEASDLEPAERRAAIARLCAGDDALEREVLRLLALSAEAGSFLEQPAVSGAAIADPADLPAGTLLAGRYRINELIGRGGMGVVYEAIDELMAGRIAVKVMRPGAEPPEVAAARWRRELQLARKVSHSGVCRVHDVGVHQQDGREIVFLTMERLNGASLHEHLTEQEVSVADAMEIARQIAEALDASHRQGVLHRDIKPRNIVIESRAGAGMRVVLTDFGLARDVTDPNATVTRTGWIAGTAGYMAPELLRGDPPSVASDLYAFAVVVHELIAAAMPRPGARVTAVLGRALNAAPGSRFQSAAEFFQVLRGAVSPRPKISKTTGATIAAGLLIVVALVAVAFRSYWVGSAAVPVASQLLLTDMVNGTTEPELIGAAEMLRTQLTQSPHFELVDDTRMRAVAKEMGRQPESIVAPEVAREIAMREQAPLVVYSALTRLGRDYLLNISLERVGATPALTRGRWSHTFTAVSKGAVPDAVHQAALWIRTTAGETPASVDEQDRPPADTTSSSWEALRLFKRAGEESSEGNIVDAMVLLEQAIQLDPEFAMAHMRLGDHLISLRRDKEGYAAWQRALALAERKQLTSRETLRIRGQFLDDTGDLVEAEKAYRAYVLHYENDFFAAFLLGGVLVELDRVEEAVPSLERAHALRPASATAAVHLALAYLDLGRLESAARVVTELDNAGHRDWAQWLRALAAFATGDLSTALGALEPVRRSTDLSWQSRASSVKASWLAESGDDAGALAELAGGIAFDVARGFRDRLADKHLHVAEIEARLEQPGAATNALRAIEVASNASRLARAGSVLIRVGDVAGAQRLRRAFDELPEVPATTAARRRLEAELSLSRGAAASALESFQRGFAGVRRTESRWPMVRGLLAAGDVDGAIRLLTRIVEHPIVIYARPEPHAPGLLRQAATVLVQLVARRDAKTADTLRRKYAPFVRSTRSTSSTASPRVH